MAVNKMEQQLRIRAMEEVANSTEYRIIWSITHMKEDYEADFMDGSTLVINDYINVSDMDGLIHIIKSYGIKRLVVASGWSGEVDRCFELQKRGLRLGSVVEFKNYIYENKYEIKHGFLFNL